jgi:membrane protein DedA with SNARE-associated domain
MADITTSITNFVTNLYMHTGLVGILLAMAIESCCIPLPSEIVMPLAGVMLITGKILSGVNPLVGLILVALAGAIGCVIGSIAAYGIGYAGGRPLMLKYGRYVLISQHDTDRADAYFKKHGSATAFFSRLLPVVRTYISLPAGIARMPFVKFCVYSFLGSFPWCLLLAYVGTVIGGNLTKLSPIFHSLDIVIIVLVVVLVALYIWRHVRNDRRARAAHAAAAANPVVSQQPVMQNGWQNQSQSGWGQQPKQQPGWGQAVPQTQQNGWGQQQPQQLPQQQGWDGQPIAPQQQGWGQPVPPQPPLQSQQPFQQQGWGQQVPPQAPPQQQGLGRTQSLPQEEWPSPNGHNGQNGHWR